MRPLYHFAKPFLGLACLVLFLGTGAAFAQTTTAGGIGLFGSGSHGKVTITKTTTLDRDMYYQDLTIIQGKTLNTGGFRVFVSGKLTLEDGARLSRDGNAADSPWGGAGLSPGTLGGSGAGGGPESMGETVMNSLGGSGGCSISYWPGSASPPSALVGGVEVFGSALQALSGRSLDGALVNGGAGGGLQGGGGGGVVVVAAHTVFLSGNSATISANGGRGYEGGGCGGGGGVVVVITTTAQPATLKLNANGGKTYFENAKNGKAGSTAWLSDAGVNGFGFSYAGTWVSTAAYKKNDVVTFGGSSYVALQPSVGADPAQSSSWSLFAAKGEKGDPGLKGDPGGTPDLAALLSRLDALEVTAARLPAIEARLALLELPDPAYVTNSVNNNVSVINNTSAVSAVNVGESPFGIAVNASGNRAYVTNMGSVSVIDTATNTVIAVVPVGYRPFGVAVNTAGTRVYVANGLSDTVSVIDAATNTVAKTVPIGGHPIAIGINPSGTRVYVANSLGTVSVMDATNDVNQIISTFQVGTHPHAVAVNASGTRVYVPSADDNNLSVIDVTNDNNQIISTVQVGGNPGGVAVNPAGTRVYVTNLLDGNVSVINAANDANEVIATVTVGNTPRGIAMNRSGTRVYVANNYSNTVSVIDATTNAVISTVQVGVNPIGIAIK